MSIEKKVVVWGAGYTARILAATMNDETIDCFIDSDPRKWGQQIMGKPVICSEDYDDWENTVFYVPFNFFDEISQILSQKGVAQDNIRKYERKGMITTSNARRDFDAAIKEIKDHTEAVYRNVLYFTAFWGLREGYEEYVKEMMHYFGLELCVVSESPCQLSVDEDDFNVLNAPKLMNYRVSVHGDVKNNEIEDVYCDKKLNEVAESVRALLPECDLSCARFCVHYMYLYIKTILDTVNPKLVIAQSSTFPSRRILEELCKNRKTRILYLHSGIIPGTISIEPNGMMGKSLIHVYSERFMSLSVSKEEEKKADDLIHRLNQEKSNYKYQPIVSSEVKCMIPKEKKKILFAGNLDELAMMIPYTDESKRYFSPIFQTSLEAGLFIEKICEKRDWQFIYKPHPSIKSCEYDQIFSKNTICIEQGDINEIVDMADLVVTISSSTSYVALTRGKPVILLGYHIINGKGCAYEVYEKELIEDVLNEALMKGYTTQQREAFVRHVAQLLKYYLYDDMQERSIRYGKSMPKNVEELFFLETLAESD